MPTRKRPENDPVIIYVPGWLLFGWGGITLINVILIRRDHRHNAHLLAHELVHFDQWNRWGVWEFLRRYVWTWMRDGFKYREIDPEEDAYRLQDEAFYLDWAMELINRRRTEERVKGHQ